MGTILENKGKSSIPRETTDKTSAIFINHMAAKNWAIALMTSGIFPKCN